MRLNIGVILASVRDNRVGPIVANWLLEEVNYIKKDDVTFELVDLKDYLMPFVGLAQTDKEKATIKRWQDKIKSFDGYILVTPEYNRMIPGALANAFQYLVTDHLANKALAFVGYGYLGASRAITNFRASLAIMNVAVVSKELNISFNTDFFKPMTSEMKFTPGDWHKKDILQLVSELTNWSYALKKLRAKE